ncbi:hypothetical protein BB561_002978 [Smittium simulii]|uniref:Choline/carnitine acyltransferase domain-containing protein n=1 Tax=Smittium simulii TaxID=133385 RepID=A0A2T9YNN1_9FUNG|nr:hypothetical protein BB561_002978 [Smittium simulii]
MSINLNYLDNHSELPKLPVPSMEDSIERLLKTVKPLVSKNEYETCKTKALDLMDPSKSLGRALHSRLDKLASDPNTISWAEQWWNDIAYFQNRQSVCFHVNYYFGFREIDIPDNSKPKQTKLSAVIINSILQYRAQIINSTFQPDSVRGTKLCMSQFKHQFGTSRIPGKNTDETKLYEYEQSKHVAIAYKGSFYSLYPYNQDDSLMSVEEIEASLNALVDMYENTPVERNECIGILTTLERDDWHSARQVLLAASDSNAHSLEIVQSAAFLLSIDDQKPESYTELSQACYTSDGTNRFYDKCFQVFVFANGRYGFSGEHSLTDGTTDVRLAKHFVFSCEQEVAVVRHSNFGKNIIKKFKVSPDAFAQMAIQLAYYKIFDHFVATYESASTRSFAHGRTETSRSVSDKSIEWCQAMLGDDPKQLAGGYISDLEKASLLRQAISRQSEYTALASRALGVDRYFMGLRQSLQPGEDWPELFLDDAFKKSSYWQLSTSQISEEFMDAYGWGQVVYDGFGIAYMVLPDAYHFNVSSNHLGSQRLCDAISSSLDEMYTLLLNETILLEAKNKQPADIDHTHSVLNPTHRADTIFQSVSNNINYISLSPNGLTVSEK